MQRGCSAAFALLGLAALGTTSPSAQQPVGTTSPAVVILRPTDHPPLPVDPSQFWMTPTKANTTRTPALSAFASAVALEADGQFAKALPILSQPLLRDHPLGEYVQYYKGLAELTVGRTTDARSTFQALTASGPAGYLWEAAALREAESDEALGDHKAGYAYEAITSIVNAIRELATRSRQRRPDGDCVGDATRGREATSSRPASDR